MAAPTPLPTASDLLYQHAMIRAPVFALLALAADPAFAQSPPPLDAVRITAITSATQAERIAADQRRTSRRHTGPITLVVEERGIGRARLLRIDGTVTTAQASQRPLCGAEVSAEIGRAHV